MTLQRDRYSKECSRSSPRSYRLNLNRNRFVRLFQLFVVVVWEELILHSFQSLLSRELKGTRVAPRQS